MAQKLSLLLGIMSLIGTASWYQVIAASAEEPTKPTANSAADESAKPPKIAITLDTSAAPEMAEWAEKTKKICEESYPLIVKFLGEKGFEPPKRTRIAFKKMDGVAYTAGRTITCSIDWFTKHPDDVGAVIHELCHVVQRYHTNPPPSWVTEGVADYVRWFQFEPENRRPHVDHPDKAKYTDGYQTTAAFFDWIVKNKDPQFVIRLNAAARRGQYDPKIFPQSAGKPLDELWDEFVRSQKR